MGSPLEKLATELHEQIMHGLAPSDLKALRLTCKFFSINTVHLLSWKIYFAPRREVMQDFQTIVNHPTISKLVNELVFDARLFIRHRFHDGDCIEGEQGCYRPTKLGRCGWAETLDGKNETDAIPTSRIYNAFYAEQEAIFSSGEDVDVLRDGLERMPKISILSIWDDFECDLEDLKGTRLYDSYERHRWYMQRTLRQFADSIPPSPWHLKHDAQRTPNGQILRFTHGKTYRSWSLQSVKNLYRALELANSKLSEFNIGLPGSPCLPIDIITIMERWGSGFTSRLTSLRVSFGWPAVFECDPRLWGDRDAALLRCGEFLYGLHLLETLELGGSGVSNDRSLVQLFLQFHWPHLRHLKLQSLVYCSSLVERFCLNHQESLQTLKFDSTYEIYDIRDYYWPKKVGKELKLNVLSLCNVCGRGRSEDAEKGVEAPCRGAHELRRMAASLMHREAFGIEVVGEERSATVVATATRVQSGGAMILSCRSCGHDNHPGLTCNEHSDSLAG